MHAISMTAVTVVTSICFAILVIALTFLIGYLIFAGREKRINFLKSYKYGKFAIIYVIALPLYLVGHIYLQTELNFFAAFFSAIDKVAALIVLMYKPETIEGVSNSWYWFTVYFVYSMVAVNAALFVVSLTIQRFWEFIQKISSHCSKQKLYILGYNENSITIYNSQKQGFKTIVDAIPKEDAEKLYIKGISYLNIDDEIAFVQKILSSVKQKGNCIIIVNTENDKKNIRICRAISAELDSLKEKKDKLFSVLKVYTFGNPEYEEIYEDIVKSGYGCINFVNKYRKIAIDFIDKYPLTRFMDERQIDYSTSLLKDDVEVNVCLLGFGKINKQIFLTSVANNQFLKQGDDGVELKPVNYFIFDKHNARDDKSLNHNFYRFDTECDLAEKEKYLPLPARPCNEKFITTDLNSAEFYLSLLEILNSGENNVNLVIVAFGNELENIEMAQKLVEKRKEWSINFSIFVKARSLKKEEIFKKDNDLFFIANNEKEVFNIDEVVSDKIFTMAKSCADSYELENAIVKEHKENKNVDINKELIDKCRKKIENIWFTYTQIKRESNLYSTLSLRFKLNLMGLDYVGKETDGQALTEEEYFNIYAGTDIPETYESEVVTDGRKTVRYDIDFKDSRRRRMAIKEHLRWNSFYISKGFIPATIEQIKTEKNKEKYTNGKNEDLRRHGCLTTYEGLIKFREICATRDGKPEAECDMLKYDYQLLDNAWWLLNENGYKIVKLNG